MRGVARTERREIGSGFGHATESVIVEPGRKSLEVYASRLCFQWKSKGYVSY